MRKIICPNCGASNDVTANNQPCAYCGTPLMLPPKKATAQTDGNGTFIFPFATELQTREGVVEAFKRYLVETDDMPFDVFDHLQIDSVEWYYMPFIRFRGQVTANWSCTQIFYQKRIKEYRPVKDFKGNTIRQEAVYETYEEYHPASGTGYSSIDIFVPCGNTDGLPDAVKSLNSWRYNNNPAIEEECEAFIFGNNVSPVNAEVRPETLAKTSQEVKSALDCAVAKEGQSVSYQSVKYYKDGHVYSTFTPDKDSDSCIFLPVVNIIYRYKGERFECAFIGTIDRDGASHTPHPVADGDSVDTTVSKMKKSLKRWTYGSVFSWVIFEIVFLLGAINAFPYFLNGGFSIFLKAVLALIIGVLVIVFVNGKQWSRTDKLVNEARPLISRLGKLRRQLNLSEVTGNTDYEKLKQEVDDTESKVDSAFAALSRFKRRSILMWFLTPVVVLIFIFCYGNADKFYGDTRKEQEPLESSQQDTTESVVRQTAILDSTREDSINNPLANFSVNIMFSRVNYDEVEDVEVLPEWENNLTDLGFVRGARTKTYEGEGEYDGERERVHTTTYKAVNRGNTIIVELHEHEICPEGDDIWHDGGNTWDIKFTDKEQKATFLKSLSEFGYEIVDDSGKRHSNYDGVDTELYTSSLKDNFCPKWTCFIHRNNSISVRPSNC